MKRFQTKWLVPFVSFALGGITTLLLQPGSQPEQVAPEVVSPPVAASVTSELPAPTPDPAIEASSVAPAIKTKPAPKMEIIAARIQPGETASSLLADYLTPQQIHRLAQASKPIFPLSRLCAGQEYKLHLTGDDFTRFEYDIDSDEQLVICPLEEGFNITRQPIAYEVQEELVRGTITSSLFDAVATSGEEPELALALADIFAWDIDFIRDLRVGDSFQVLIEKRSREGNPAGYGKILAAEFVNQDKPFQAFAFEVDGQLSYYDADGNSVRKAFLKAPLSFTRISSGFTRRRFHPITKTWRAHPAIDYAAPSGTPIKTVGDGVITQIGYSKYNGNHIKIRHNSSYETLYLHMRRFAKGMKRGKKLEQGQVIGYVGSTGLATGPHLCFRMYKHGSPVNPTKVKIPKADPVPQGKLAEFKSSISPYLDRFQDDQKHVLARNF